MYCVSQQTAVQFSHFALPMGSGTGATVVSLGTVLCPFFWLHNRAATPVEPCYLSSELSCIKSSCIAVLKDRCSGCADSLARANQRAPSFNSEVGQVRTASSASTKFSSMSYATYWVGLMGVSKHVTQAPWCWAS